MAQWHSIYGRSGAVLSRRDIAERVLELWYGEGSPTFAPAPDTEPAWEHFAITLPGVARPLAITNTTDPVRIHDYLAEFAEQTPGTVRARLAGTRRVLDLEFAPDLLSESAWELLDALQSLLAVHVDGLLVAPEGVYDAQLRCLALSPPQPPGTH
jgi:hypothetical protein